MMLYLENGDGNSGAGNRIQMMFKYLF